ncbi:MAG: hypothetical protein NTZ26_12455 [Candidatus Aminicenantes bacterium]|nr:hypothetical protein [Candidatus Aminicenantes bacterium]
MNQIKRRSPKDGLLPVEVVFHPSWWHRYAGLSFDPDFYYHPVRRVEDERRMEMVLFERFGDLGLGEDHRRDVPSIGAVHNAAGFLLSEMLGCRVVYPEDGPPLVVPAEQPDLTLDVEAAFASPAYLRFERLIRELKARFGYVSGDVNWAGVLNLALDLRGQAIFLDMVDRPAEVHGYFRRIGQVIERFTALLERESGTTSISVNRTVRHLAAPVFLHSECALTMISVAHYRDFLFPLDEDWSRRKRPFGVHYCGADPHRFAGSFVALPHLDFLDVGWGGDLKLLRERLPDTFLNIRLSPVEIVGWSETEIRRAIEERMEAAGDPRRTGVCCINMDDRVTDAQVRAIFETVFDLRLRFAARF